MNSMTDLFLENLSKLRLGTPKFRTFKLLVNFLLKTTMSLKRMEMDVTIKL